MKSVAAAEKTRLSNVHRFLRDAVDHLALSAEDQVQWLKEIGTYPSADELALELDAWLPLADQLAAAEMLSPALVEQISVMDRILDEISGIEENWTPEALETDVRWAEVRRIARAVAPCL